ncbi:MFS transporter [Yersinia pseudotuberculosis]|uniref:Transporter protein n=2 Tax=Yersinia pseudotuberculosis complex TaxID=1649845 RepID=A0ABP1ZK80_9GAMM|nr:MULTISPECIES: MFS transporter [Yersinia pseudotuberculosis complex]PSH12620.1 MFS transporter [Yersinia pseudotuberculosis]CNC58889.1 putative transporter protein [Yersinia pseudotuberculosis]CRG52115.1 putative transporter protein [Yersinia wautersii]SUP86203.1 putative transporter protein [Yersinia pseudotuberculosis]
MSNLDSLAVSNPKGVDSRTTVSKKSVRKVMTASIAGTIIEWYDYSLYGAAASLVINRLFFPSLSPSAAILAAFATFAVGFMARPLGGVIISHIGDKYGRKPALILSITLMGAATLALGLLPTYFDIGVWASIILVVLRLLQGFGAGAELAGAQTFVAEYVPPKERAFYTSLISASTGVAILLATGAFLLVSQLPDEAFIGWGWRIPFLFSSLLFVVAIYIRKNLDETPEYVDAMAKAEHKNKKDKVPLSALIKNSPKELIYAFLSVTGHQANGYVLSVFSLSYMANTLGMEKSDGLIALMFAVTANTIATPLMGKLADRLGPVRVFSFGAIFLFLFAFPLFWMLDTRNLFIATLGMSIAYAIGHGATSGAQGAFMANLFPTEYRFSGMALSRELNSMLVAGPTPFIAAALVTLGGGEPTYVVFYLMVCCMITLFAVQKAKKLTIHR